jgi:adenylosuccinate lyase
MEAGKVVKVQGGENDLIERIAADESFGMSRDEILSLIDPKAFVGRSPEQVEEFLASAVKPVLDRYGDQLGLEVEINV